MFEWFTADLHLGHGNIIKYCNRPYKDVEHMNERLIANINDRCRTDDILYHLGDFCTYGRAKGVEGLRLHPIVYEVLMKPKLININGNHDPQNKVKGSIQSTTMKLGKYLVSCQHHPPFDDRGIPTIEVDAYLCGHVHEKWKVATHLGKPVINVGCDVWDWMPVRKDTLIGLIEKTVRSL